MLIRFKVNMYRFDHVDSRIYTSSVIINEVQFDIWNYVIVP